MSQPRSTPDDEAAMLLLRFFGQPVPEASPVAPSPGIQTSTLPRTTSIDGSVAVESALTLFPLRSASISQEDSSSRASFQKEQNDMHPNVPPLSFDKSPRSPNHSLKRKRTGVSASDGMASGNVESRLESEVSGRSPVLETAMSAPRARSDLSHFMGYDNQLYRCICGTTIEPDAGTSIQCESCLAWQHAGCFGLGGNELEGTTYLCQLCSDETGKHQPDELYVKYIQHLAEGNLPAHLPLVEDTTQPAEEYTKDIKRSRFTGSSRGKSRVRHSVTLSKPVEAEMLEEPATPISAELLPVVPPRAHRKKSVLNSRAAKGKSSSAPGPVISEGPLRDDIQDETVIRDVPSEEDAISRVLDYIPICDNIIPSGLFQAQGRTCPPLVNSSINKPVPKPTDQGPHTPTSDRSAETPTTSRQIASSSTNGDTQLTFIKAVEQDSPTRATLRSSDTVTEEQDFRPDSISPTYGVFARSDLPPGRAIGHIRGEIYSLATYVQQPANQYAVIGLPKPFVQRVGSPFNLVVDARRYGNELRFVRSSCDANAVLLPSWNPEESSFTVSVKLARAVRQGEEITLPWAWDEFHLVHEIRGLQAVPRFHPGSDRLAHVGRHLSRVFKSCACTGRSGCLMAKLTKPNVDLQPVIAKYAERHDQSFARTLETNFSIPRGDRGVQWSSSATHQQVSHAYTGQPQDVIFLDFDSISPYELDYIIYEDAAATARDCFSSSPSADGSSDGSFLHSSSEEPELISRQDLLYPASFAIGRTTGRSELAWSTSSLDEMDSGDELASVSETSTLTEPIGEDGKDDDLMGWRSSASRRPSIDTTRCGEVRQTGQHPDLAIPQDELEMIVLTRASRVPEAASHRVKSAAMPLGVDPNASDTVTYGSTVPIAKLDSVDDLLTDAEPTVHVGPGASAAGALDEKPEVQAKKQRIDLTKFMCLGASVRRQSSPEEHMIHCSVTRMNSADKASGLQTGVPYNQHEWPRQANTTESGRPTASPWWENSDIKTSEMTSDAALRPPEEGRELSE